MTFQDQQALLIILVTVIVAILIFIVAVDRLGWLSANRRRIGCWLRLGHQLPLVLDRHTLTCKRCGHSWVE